MVDTTSKALRNTANQTWINAAQNQKFRRAARTIREDPQHLEELGQALHFIDHDQTAQRFQREHRRGKARQVGRDLQVE